jgi:hypothetical protein
MTTSHHQTAPRRALLPALAVVAAFPLALLAWRRSLDVTFFALSIDDFHRALYGWEVTQGNLLPSPLWPPLQFWVQALALLIYPRILSVPYLVNLAAATGALLCLVLLGRALGLGALGLLALALLAASVPWLIWLSLSGLAEPLFLLGIAAAYLGVARWHANGRDRNLWLAAAGLLAAGMVRFDAWGHAVPFTLGVAWLWWRAPHPRPLAWLLAAALPWSFPAAWLAWQSSAFGDPLFFSHVTRGYWLATQPPLPLVERLTWQPRDLLALAGITLPLGLSGLWLLRRQPGVPLMALMWLASFALLIQSTLSYTITQNNPQRLVLVHTLLLAPGTALALERLARRSPGALLAASLLAALLATRLAAIPAYPNALDRDVMQVGSHVGALRTMGDVQPGERIMVEVIFWNYLTLHVLMDDPAAVIYDRAPTLVLQDGAHTLDDEANPSMFALPSDLLRQELARRNVRVVITHSERAATSLASIARETQQIGRFRVWVVDIR